MSVHYKFKAALDYSTVTFDGIHISVTDLKKEIIEQKHLKQNADFDLQIMNAQTKEVYEDESTLIPKNTSVIVARVPVTEKKRTGGPGGNFGHHRSHHHPRNQPTSIQPSALAKGVDLASMDATEEEKIKAMMSQSTADYDPSKYQKIRGSGQHGRVPPTYRCNKCNNLGHWIKDCPFQSEHLDVKKSTGIPRSFMVHVEGPGVPGALMTPEGRFAVPAVDHTAYMEKNKPAEPPPQKPKIPDELVCTLCDDLMTDALLVPCCANSYCDECIRKALLDSDDQECPSCHERDILPTSLIANRFLRTTVNKFKNETGYSKPPTVIKKDPVVVVDLTDKKEDGETRKLSLDELPVDLFPHSPRKIDLDIDEKDSESFQGQNTDTDKTDLYDFNDGSIPSPFASASDETPQVEQGPTSEQAIKTIGTISHNFYPESKPPIRGPPTDRIQHQQYHQPPSHHMHHQNRPPKEHYRHPRTPLQSGMPLPSMHYSQPPPSRRPPPHMLMQGQHGLGPSDLQEPPPPGFGDILPLPPGEEDPTGRSRDENLHPQENDLRGGNANPDGPAKTVGLLPFPKIPPFNPTQPPPGFPPAAASQPPSTGPPEGMFAGPPSHNFPPFHGEPDYRMNERHGPPPMYHQGPPMGPMSTRDRESRYPPRDRMMPRKPPFRDSRPRERERPEEIRAGAIDDPLKEFERRMREMDRRKKMQQPIGAKRSRSRSFSPGPSRRSLSPFAKRSRSRSPFSRSPSPSFAKRKRPPPIRRRTPYSRTPSRSPPRRHLRSRSRSRSRNRSITPTAPSKRRSPRRAPPLSNRPYSPSPPPSRFPTARKDKDEFYENRPPRYDPPASRFFSQNVTNNCGNGNAPYPSSTLRDYSDSSSSKYDMPPSKYVDQQKFEPFSGGLLAPPIDRNRIEGPGGGPSISGGSKFEKLDHRGHPPSSSRGDYHQQQSGGGNLYRDRERDNFKSDRGVRGDRGDRERRDDNRGEGNRAPMLTYDYEAPIMPPGTEGTMPPQGSNNSNNTPILPSLLELSFPPPSNNSMTSSSPSQRGQSMSNPPPESSSTSGYLPSQLHHAGGPGSYQNQHQPLLAQHHHQQQLSLSLGEKERRSRPYGPSTDRDRGDDRSMRDRPDNVRDRDGRDRERGERGRERERERERGKDSQRERDAIRERDKGLGSKSVSLTPDRSDSGRKRHFKKSRDSSSEKLDKKKERKEKKKHKRKKEKEEKKIRKSKRLKSSKGESEDDQTTGDEGGPPSRRNSTGENNGAATTETGIVDDESLKVKMESDEKMIESTSASGINGVKIESGHEIEPVNSNLTVIVCDSTVKSPERSLSTGLSQKSSTSDLDFKMSSEPLTGDEIMATGMNLEEVKTDSTDVMLKEVTETLTMDTIHDRPGIDDMLDSKAREEFFDQDSGKLIDVPSTVPSKWDQFGEDDVPNTMISYAMNVKEIDNDGTSTGKELQPKKVTSEVLKRAENAIFQKAIIGISSTTGTAVRKSSPTPHQASSKRKVYVEKLETPESDKDDLGKGKDLDYRETRKSGSSFQITLTASPSTETSNKPEETTATSTSGTKRSVHDRLGSKISEDRHRSSSSRERDRDRDKDRHKTQVKSQVKSFSHVTTGSYRERTDRERVDRRRSRTPVRLAARGVGRGDKVSPHSKDDRGRNRERERGRFNDRRSRSKSTKRSLSKSRRDRDRLKDTRDDFRRQNRKKTPLELATKRNTSRSSSRENRHRRSNRSPRESTSSNSRLARTNKTPHQGKGEKENATAVSRVVKETEDREPTPPGLSDKPQLRTKIDKTEEEQAWKKQAEKFSSSKFVPIGSIVIQGDDTEVNASMSQSTPPVERKDVVLGKAASNDDESSDNVSSMNKANPVPLAVRKQKGRINIKLSSTTSASKGDPSKSSSSSDEDEDHPKQHDTSKPTIHSGSDSDDERREEMKRKRKERKKTKRRRSDSSSSSSSSDDSPRKSKRSKKKKKKSKKKKKNK